MAIFLVLTVLMWGATPVLEKLGLKRLDPIYGVAIRSFAVTIALIIYLLSTGRINGLVKTDLKSIFIFSLTGIMAGLLGMITYFKALRLGPTSQVVPIAATYPLVAAILSVLILGENLTPLRIVGTVFIIIGIWLVQV